jgi:CheY-like chemotaxis protein
VSIVDGRPRRVLVVDDERHVRFMLCDALAAWGCTADAVTNAAEGLERLEPGGYDVLLTDFRMPGMNGLELVERARKRNGALRVIMLTGSGADLDPAARRLGFTLLRKPLDLRLPPTRLTALADETDRRRRHRSDVAIEAGRRCSEFRCDLNSAATSVLDDVYVSLERPERI